jgi:DNA polymerase-3 subunit alpha
LPPDINRSGLKFLPEAVAGIADPGDAKANLGAAGVSDPGCRQNAIRYGLAAIKHVGEGAMELSIQERERGGEFTSLEDFCGRLGSRIANRKMLESLVKTGAFDFLERERAELFACIDEALAASAAAHRDRAAGQVSLFGDLAPEVSSRRRSVIAWSQHEKMSYEKELLGFYVTGHPLDAYVDIIARGNYQTIGSLAALADRSQFKIVGAIAQVEKKFTRKEGKPFAVLWLEDLTGTLEVVVWNETYVQVSDSLLAGRVIGVRGTIDKRDESLRATAQKIKVLTHEKTNGISSNGGSEETPAVLLQFSIATTAEELREVREILSSSPGRRPVQLLFGRTGGEPLRVEAGADFHVDLTRDLEEKLAKWLVTAKSEREVAVDPTPA